MIKLKDILKDSLLTTADVVELYLSIKSIKLSHKIRLKAMEKGLDRRKDRKISINNLIEMAEIV